MYIFLCARACYTSCAGRAQESWPLPVSEVKDYIICKNKYSSVSRKKISFRVLGHQCIVRSRRV